MCFVKIYKGIPSNVVEFYYLQSENLGDIYEKFPSDIDQILDHHSTKSYHLRLMCSKIMIRMLF